MRPSTVDARGTNYVKSLFQLFTGLFLAQLWITAIFVFSKNWACVALEGVIVVVTIAARLWMKWKFLPLVDAVPISAIKYAAGDPTYSYPIHDQGLKEIKVEGKNYWEGGNQLGLGPDPKDQVLPDRIPGNGPSYGYDQQQQQYHRGSDSSAVDTKVGHGELVDKPKSPFTDSNNNHDAEKSAGFNPVNKAIAAPTQGVSWLTSFFQPKKDTFDIIKSDMPSSYFNYIEYHSDFIRHAYDDPAVTAEEPHIWIARDPMGLSEIEKIKLSKKGFKFLMKMPLLMIKVLLIFTGPPPAYEEPIRV